MHCVFNLSNSHNKIAIQENLYKRFAVGIVYLIILLPLIKVKQLIIEMLSFVFSIEDFS
jgi:hypothetical protein